MLNNIKASQFKKRLVVIVHKVTQKNSNVKKN